MLTSPGFVDALVTTLVYSVAGHRLRDRARPGRGAGAARRRSAAAGWCGHACSLPYVAPVVAATFVWTTMLNPQFGIVNHYGTMLLGWDEPIAFLSSSEPVSLFGLDLPVSTALLTVVALRGVALVPVRLPLPHRADPGDPGVPRGGRGGGRRHAAQRFRHIVLPQLLPTIAVLTVLRFIWTFNNFDDIYLLTGGGAGTQVVTVRVFDYLINRGDIGAAAAQALVLAAILAVLVGGVPEALRPAGGGRMSTPLNRDLVERRFFGVAAAAGDLGLLRDHACSPSTTWCCSRSGRSTSLLQDPGALLALRRRDRPRAPTRDVLKLDRRTAARGS